jgi:hypothetical protein
MREHSSKTFQNFEEGFGRTNLSKSAPNKIQKLPSYQMTKFSKRCLTKNASQPNGDELDAGNTSQEQSQRKSMVTGESIDLCSQYSDGKGIQQ